MKFIVLTDGQIGMAKSLGNPEHATVDPRIIDYKDSQFVGMGVIPARVLFDTTYLEYCPKLIEYLDTLPIHELDPEKLFVSVDENGPEQ